ncbi:hypothetical protein D3C87_1215810 [compost metagenome]
MRAQHPAGGRLLADRGGLATGHRRLARLRHRSVLGAGAVFDLRHRRVPRRAEDERHHAGHRPWHPQTDRRALHLPPSVHRRCHRIARRCRGFCGADADRHPGDPGPGDHRQHRRRGADLHLAVADAGGTVLCRCRRQGRRACAEHRQPRREAQRLRQTVGRARSLHHRQVGHRRRSGCGVDGHRRFHGQPEPEDRRPGKRGAGAARGFALQPRQRLHHQPLRAVQRPVRGDDQDRAGRLPELQDPGPRRPPGLGAATVSGRAGDRVPGQRGTPDHRRHLRRQPQAQQHPAQPGRAQLRRAASLGQLAGAVQY